MSDVEITYNEFAKAGGEEGIRRSITQTCVEIHANVVTDLTADTGALRNSYMYVTNWDGEKEFNGYGSGEKATQDKKISLKPGKLEGLVGSNMEYATYVEFGTKPHTISVKNAKVLTDGKNFFGKTVQHPGTVAQPAMRSGGMAVRGATARQIGEKYGREAMKAEFEKRKKTTRKA